MRMSLNRFLQILKYARFAEYGSNARDENSDDDDEIADKVQRPIDKVIFFYDTFRANCRHFHTPLGQHIALDEIVVRFLGNCSFLVYMPGKKHQKAFGFTCFVMGVDISMCFIVMTSLTLRKPTHP